MSCDKCLHNEVCTALYELNGIPRIGSSQCAFFRDEAKYVEVRHGHWKYLWLDAVCSECGYINEADVATRCRTDPPYCPKCGAKMDGAKCENSEREGKDER